MALRKPENVGHDLVGKSLKSAVLAPAAVIAALVQAHSAAGATMTIPVNCTVAGKEEPGMSDVICREFIQHLAKTYAGHQFRSAALPEAGPALSVTLNNISKHGMSIRLAWKTKDGAAVTGEEMSLIVTDHDLTPSMRASLYQQATSKTPMPK